MTEEPTLSEIGRITDRHEYKISWIEQHYVSEKVLLAMLSPLGERLLRIEQDDHSKTSGNRTWLLSLAQTVIGVILGIVAGLMTNGGH